MDYKKRHGKDTGNKPFFKAITDAMRGQNNEQLLWHTDHDKSRKETGSLYQQMPGTHFEKCAHIRLFIGYLMTLVGKKMIFMGDELAQKTDWDTRMQDSASASSVEWGCKSDPCHAGVQSMVERLNATGAKILYLSATLAAQALTGIQPRYLLLRSECTKFSQAIAPLLAAQEKPTPSYCLTEMSESEQAPSQCSFRPFLFLFLSLSIDGGGSSGWN